MLSSHQDIAPADVLSPAGFHVTRCIRMTSQSAKIREIPATRRRTLELIKCHAADIKTSIFAHSNDVRPLRVACPWPHHQFHVHPGPDFRPEERCYCSFLLLNYRAGRVAAVKRRTRMLALAAVANCCVQGVLLGNSRRITYMYVPPTSC